MSAKVIPIRQPGIPATPDPTASSATPVSKPSSPSSSAIPDKTPTRWVQGSYNTWVYILGVNGCGKTTRAREVVLAHARQGVRVFCHDPDGQLSQVAPFYNSPEAWRKAEDDARRDRRPFPRTARFDGSPELVMRLGLDAAARSSFACPSLFVVDEGSSLYGKARRQKFDQEMLEVVTRRRNRMMGACILSQWATMLHRTFLANATELHLMRLQDARQGWYLQEFLPDPVTLTDGRQIGRDELLRALPTLERGQCFAVKLGF